MVCMVEEREQTQELANREFLKLIKIKDDPKKCNFTSDIQSKIKQTGCFQEGMLILILTLPSESQA